MKVFTIANQKGGIGKTTTATTLADILQYLGYKVLFIDADTQCNSTDTYNAKTYESDEGILLNNPEINTNIKTLYNVLFDQPSIQLKDAIQKTPFGDIVAGDIRFQQADALFNSISSKEYILAEKIAELKNYDYLVIDTGPTLNTMLESTLIAADEVIIPICPGFFELKGLKLLEQTISQIHKRKNPDLKIGGLLITKYNTQKKTIISQEACETIEKEAQRIHVPFFGKISDCVKVTESQASHIGLMEYDAKCSAALEYMDFVKQLIGNEENKSTNQLLDELAESILED